jgi:hypothetical protein
MGVPRSTGGQRGYREAGCDQEALARRFAFILRVPLGLELQKLGDQPPTGPKLGSQTVGALPPVCQPAPSTDLSVEGAG